ncbi:histidine phosphatase family protein [Oscillatoria sp. CS-180]|uniref:histidine phosphatase family protein n=1 Tax=Oscillatoria sp. CS-180 TaxID=3021720 RepID=UPI0023304AB5|nr:histidine phosphatase family protein [Oscillatoria sp. CS-180]MDB9525517.1 histidine phosphatase family protein [Oscillatoria sp. CS-180]
MTLTSILHSFRLCALTVLLVASCATRPDSSPDEVDPTPLSESPSPAVSPTPEMIEVDNRPNNTDATVSDASDVLTKEELWQRLQQPDEALYAVLLRHALAPGSGDPSNFQLEDCSTQRNLSAEGRSQAQQIGQAFRDRGVEVQQVLSSQWCRSLETAELMAVGDVEPFLPLNSFFRDRATAESQTNDVKNYLLDQAETPGVVVMVTHQVNITALTDIVPQSGEAVVLQVQADELTQIGQFRPEL